MNRTFKFRIWDTSMRRWLAEDSQYLQMDGTKVHAAPWSTIDFTLPSENYVVQQYTGIKNGEGKEIYEGDIIRTSYEHLEMTGGVSSLVFKGTVVWDERLASFCVVTPLFKGIRKSFAQIKLKNTEILGNIFEHYVLLKNETE